MVGTGNPRDIILTLALFIILVVGSFTKLYLNFDFIHFFQDQTSGLELV